MSEIEIIDSKARIADLERQIAENRAEMFRVIVRGYEKLMDEYIPDWRQRDPQEHRISLLSTRRTNT